jgi:methyl-accepting chemotaxis protein
MKSFKNLRFVTKLWLLIGAVGLVGATAALLLASLVTSYEQILTTEVRQQDTARKAQVTFKKQIQEWKDILLRGYDPEQLTRYTDQYHAREKEVKDITSALGKELTDPKAKALIADFIKAHDQMTSHYDTALRAFIARLRTSSIRSSRSWRSTAATWRKPRRSPSLPCSGHSSSSQ